MQNKKMVTARNVYLALWSISVHVMYNCNGMWNVVWTFITNELKNVYEKASLKLNINYIFIASLWDYNLTLLGILNLFWQK
jgi:hypothetical protein